MFSSFERLVRPYIPVVAHTKQKQQVVIVEKPIVGIRWGKPSRFEYDVPNTNDDEYDYRFSVTYLDGQEVINAAEVYREWEIVEAETVPEEDKPPLTAKFERMKEAYFYVGETEEYSEKPYGEGNVPWWIQPEITITYHYIKLAFPLNNSEDTISESGTRGEHPDDLLEQKKAEFYGSVAGQNQASKEYWEGVF